MRCAALPSIHSESEQDEEGHGQAEESHSFGQGESKDGVGEELLLQRWVTRKGNQLNKFINL